MDTQQQKHYKVLLIGDSCTDKYHYGTCERLSSEAPVPVFKLLTTETKKGMVLNVEQNLRSFELSVDVITNDSSLITKERFIDQRSGQHLLRFDSGEDNPLVPLNLKMIELDNYDCVAISDYNKGTLDYENCLIISNLCVEKGKFLFVDSKKEDLSCFNNAIIKINEEERKKISNLPNKFELITTLGPNGASWNNQLFRGYQTEVFDVCGAGDTFFAALISEFLRTNKIMPSIIFANKCASITVKHNGCYSLTDKDLREVKNGLRS